MKLIFCSQLSHARKAWQQAWGLGDHTVSTMGKLGQSRPKGLVQFLLFHSVLDPSPKGSAASAHGGSSCSGEALWKCP